MLKDINGKEVKVGDFVKMSNKEVYKFMGSYKNQDDVPNVNNILYFIGDYLYMRKVNRSFVSRIKTRFRKICYKLNSSHKFCTHL